ncbi:MAG: YraN family protein [Gammaproteobacteria bacterium]|nr:YraN family protein [Gammaproteobacteria bacterium]NNM00002.1 YraN family protein [Gammaproteobacteria bacterium]
MRPAGTVAEQVAEQYLAGRGLKLITRNYSCRFGEIDLVMEHAGECVFVEVRHRSDVRHGTPAATVSRAKQQKILKCARHYLARIAHSDNTPCRIDVVGITGVLDNPQIDWIRNAISA